MADNPIQSSDKTSNTVEKRTLREHVSEVIRQYFINLKGEEPRHIYDFFLDEIEEPLLKVVMAFTRNNQSEAARILGISRGTLRTKLKKYGLL